MIAAEGEHKASRALRHAAEVIAGSPAALQVNICCFFLCFCFLFILYFLCFLFFFETCGWGDCLVASCSLGDHLFFLFFFVFCYSLFSFFFLRFWNTSIVFRFMRSRVYLQLFKILNPPKAFNDWWACCALFNFLPARSDLLIYYFVVFFSFYDIFPCPRLAL